MITRITNLAPLATLLALALPGVSTGQPIVGDLVDVANPTHPEFCGIVHSYSQHTAEFVEGGGLAVGDFNSDGYDDVYLPANGGSPSSLYQNDKDGTFTDVAAQVGVDDPAFACGVGLFLDYDNDGDLDLYTASHAGDGKPGTSYAPDLTHLFRNGGSALGYGFQNVSPAAGFQVEFDTTKGTVNGWLGGACAGDYDQDGFQDIFVTYWFSPAAGSGKDDLWRLWRNGANPVHGDPGVSSYTPRTFTDETFEAGLDINITPGEAWQPTFVDVNKDGWPDLHVAVDYGLDLMLINNQNSTFTNVATAVGLNGVPAENRNEMGTAWGDVDFDLDQDLHTTNLNLKDRLYRNDSVGASLAFVDVAAQTGLFDSTIGWGTVFFDFDNDMDLDHATATGMRFPTVKPYYNHLHMNLWPQTQDAGMTVSWMNVSAYVPDYSKTNTLEGDAARGLAVFDYDNDGDLDLISSRQYAPVAVYRSSLAGGNRWLQVSLIEKGGSLNTTGAKLYLRGAGLTQFREVAIGTSFMSQSSARQHFGLGPAGPYPIGVSPVEWLLVCWADGRMQLEKSLVPNQIQTLARGGKDATGDLDGDGHRDANDRKLLLLLISNPSLFAAIHPDMPGMITADCDHDGVIGQKDLRAWEALRPY